MGTHKPSGTTHASSVDRHPTTTMMLQMASSNTFLQTIVDDDKRGRVLSLYTMAYIGVAPLGSLIAGALAERFGVQATIAFGGIVCIAGAGAFARQIPAFRAQVGPIYVRMGIIPAAAPAGTSEESL